MFRVTATDADLEGYIVYTLVGEFPVQSFFTVNATTGVVNLRNSLLADTTQNTIYTVCIPCHYLYHLLILLVGVFT